MDLVVREQIDWNSVFNAEEIIHLINLDVFSQSTDFVHNEYIFICTTRKKGIPRKFCTIDLQIFKNIIHEKCHYCI